MDKLNELREKYPDNLIVVSGELVIDLPDNIDEYNESDTIKTFDVSSNKVTFDNCLLDQVIEVLEGQYAISKRSASRVGSVEVTVINPVPFV